MKKLKKLSTGRVSYLIDNNPDIFPSRSFVGKPIKGIKYLKFIRCNLPRNTKKVTKEAFNKSSQTLPQDSKHVLHFILPNPSNKSSGLYRTGDLKKIAYSKMENG